MLLCSSRRLFAPAWVAGLTLSALLASPLAAQGTLDPGCQNAALVFQDACQKTVDMFSYLAPQLGTAVAGGNATLGQGGTLGGLGHFTVGIRANAVDGSVPKVNNVTIHTTGAVADTFGRARTPLPMPAVDAGIGLFRGLPLGLTHVGGVDALVSALYIPRFTSSHVALRPDHSLKLGFGARLGVLEESGFIPGVSVTYLVRSLPRTTIIGTTGTGDSLRVQNLDLTTKAWRVVASKSFFIVGLAAGVGQDHYTASTGVSTEVSGVSSGTTSLASPQLTISRTSYFGDAMLNMSLVKFVAEIGKVSGGSIPSYNVFAGKPAGASRLYGSIGLRIKI